MAKGKPTEERRHHKRLKSRDVAIKIAGKKYHAANLSIGGTLIGGYDGSLSAGALLTVTGIGPVGGRMKKVTIRARVNRAEPESAQLALSFHDLDGRAYEILQNAMAEKLEGMKPPEEPDPLKA